LAGAALFPEAVQSVGKLLLAAWLALTVCAGPAAAERLTRIDGGIAEVTVTAIEGGGVALSNAAVPLGELWRIERTPPAFAASGMVERIILDGGEIPARRLTVQNGVCRFDWAGGSDVAIPQAAVRALILETGAGAATREATARALDKRIAADQVAAVGEDNLVLTLDGRVKTVGAGAIVMEYQGKDRTVSRAKVGAVVFGRTGTPERAAGALPWKATVAGGAWMEAGDARLADGVLTLTIGAGTLEVPWAKVCRVEHRGKKVRFLSGMDPVRATEGAVVTVPLPWQRDRSAMNRPLRLKGEIHDTGLGTHAPSELVFDVPEGAQRFMAIVGLDEEYGRRGDCVVMVQIDDREALRRRLRGTDEPLPVDIEIGNGRRLTLRAEPGENHDLGDHVNWYDARLLFGP
jgi:hypothetical protein